MEKFNISDICAIGCVSFFQPMDSDVIEVSDGEEDDEQEVETEICELQDAANLMDEQGNIVLNPGRDKETECEICLPPQIARVIKPHQVSSWCS